MRLRAKLRPFYVIQMQWISCTLFGVVWDLHHKALSVLVPFLEITVSFSSAKD